jgi:hypothetical protein
MAAYLDNSRATVAEHGWMIQGVFPTAADPEQWPFAYTVGLAPAGLPELVIVGLPPDPGGMFLNALARRALTEEPQPGNQWTVEENPALVWKFAPIHPEWIAENVTMTVRLWPHLAGEVRALQVLWPDDRGAHPDDPAWSLPADVQPLLANPPEVTPCS